MLWIVNTAFRCVNLIDAAVQPCLGQLPQCAFCWVPLGALARGTPRFAVGHAAWASLLTVRVAQAVCGRCVGVSFADRLSGYAPSRLSRLGLRCPSSPWRGPRATACPASQVA